jgi:hypothetical protein
MPRLDQLGRRLGLHLHRSRSRLHRPHIPSRPHVLELKLIIPPSTTAETVSFQNERGLTLFLRSLNGSLSFLDPNGKRRIVSEYKTLSPLETYNVFSPFSMPMQNIQHYEQASNKGFEDKSRRTLVTYMAKEGIEFTELNRVIKDKDNLVAEWEGVFEIEDGREVYFLECKHRMTAVSTSLSQLC